MNSSCFNAVTIIVTIYLTLSDYIMDAIGLSYYKITPFTKLIIAALLIFYLMRYKRRQAKILNLLSVMAENNKLHSIRMLVAIEKKYQERVHNKLKLESISFHYQIKPSKDSNKKSEFQCYDITYKLSFKLKKSIFNFFNNLIHSSKNCPFSFLIICENNNLDCPIFIPDSKNEHHTIPLQPKSVTIRGAGQDQSDDFSGLYELPITIPGKFNLNSSFHFDVTYTMRKNLSKASGQYDFAIIPYNYTRGQIDTFEIQITSQDVELKNVELQTINCNGALDNPSLFESSRKSNGKERVQLYDKSIHPMMSSVYFIQFNYSCYNKKNAPKLKQRRPFKLKKILKRKSLSNNSN